MKLNQKMSAVLKVWIILELTVKLCEGGCTWPSPFVSSTWQDNTRDQVIFGADTLTQFEISVQGSTVSQWECLDTSYFDSEGILLIKSTQTFLYLGGTWTTYLCLEMTKVSDYSYSYYQKHEQDVSGGYERGKFSQDGTLTGKASICSTSYTVPAAEFHFMVKSGFEGDAKQYCSPSLLQRMDYTHTTTGGTVTCDTSTDNWDVCTDRTTMTFNYTTCNTQMAYSAAAEVYCMVNITSLYEYVVVYNADVARTKFACIVSNGAGTVASVVDNNCTTTQTPTSYAQAADGTDIGYLVTMTPIVTCPMRNRPHAGGYVHLPNVTANAFMGPGTGESDGGLIPIIAGTVGGILAIAIAAGIIIYCLKSSKKGVSPHDPEKEKLPEDTRNGHAERINVEGVDTNPALTVSPERNTLTPLPPNPETKVTTPRVLPPIASHV